MIMEYIDAVVGNWIVGQPYTNTHRNAVVTMMQYKLPTISYDSDITINDIKNAGRDYFCSSDSLWIKQNCGWVNNYFKKNDYSVVIFQKRNIYIEGRRCYIIPSNIPRHLTFQNISLTESISPDEVDPLIYLLRPFAGEWFDLYSLICSQFANSDFKSGYEKMLATLKQCPEKSKCFPCTEIGSKIARSLIRIAATRIFSDPVQSIMELPVNSMDAYSPDNKVGKFGMGFFSFLYWLVGHPKRTLTIMSFYKSDAGYGTYVVKIREIGGSLKFNLMTIPDSNIRRTGVHITMNDFSEAADHIIMRKYIDRLQYTNVAKIYFAANANENFYNKDKIVEPINRRCESDNSIFIGRFGQFGNAKFMIEDYATGIPLSVLFSSLFVPSISTKTIQMSEGLFGNLGWRNDTKIVLTVDENYVTTKVYKTFLKILVNKVVVYETSVELNIPVTRPGFLSFIIDMPPNTRIPVSRDDIILTSSTRQIFTDNIKKLLEESKVYHSLYELQTLFEQYMNFTANVDIKEIISNEMFDFEKRNIIYLIPQEYARLYHTLDTDYLISKRYDITKLEENLAKVLPYNDKIWIGMKVYIHASFPDNISDGGLRTFLFINKRYAGGDVMSSNTISTITSAYTKSMLLRYDSPLDKEFERTEVDIFNDKISSFTPKARELFKTFIRRYYGLEPLFNFMAELFGSKFEAIICIYKVLGEQGYYTILDALFSRMNTFKGNSTYGQGKYNLSFSVNCSTRKVKEGRKMTCKIITDKRAKKDRNYENENLIEPADVNYITKYLYYTILSTVEQQYTTISLCTFGNVPVYLRACYGILENYVQYILMYRILFNLISHHPGIRDSLVRDPRMRKYLCRMMLPFMREINLSHTDLVEMHDFSRNFWTVIKLEEKAVLYCSQYSQQLAIPQFAGSISLNKEASKNSVTFTSLQLISYLFEHNISFEEFKTKGIKLLDEVSKTTPQPLQLIDIAVNQGTTKSFIDAVLTETVQNSVDAIRGYKGEIYISTHTIDVNIENYKNELVLTITDFIGMPPEAFISLSIPFLSTKTPSEMVTGEMGSGFFNVYRETSRVIIHTKMASGDIYSTYDEPIREGDRVIDIKKTIHIQKDVTARSYTQILLFIPYTSEDDKIEKISAIRFYMNNVIALIKNSVASTRFMGNIINSYTSLTIPFRWHADTLPVEIGLINNLGSNLESFIYTKDIPFTRLKSLEYWNENRSSIYHGIDAKMGSNIFINFKHAAYVPSQARTRVKLNPDLEMVIGAILRNALFIKLLFEPDIHGYITNFSSTASIENIGVMTNGSSNSILKTNVESVIMETKLFGTNPTYNEIINECRELMIKKNTDYNRVKDEVDGIIKKFDSGNDLANSKFRDLVIGWLRSKKAPIPPTKVIPIKTKAITKGKGAVIEEEVVRDAVKIPDKELYPYIKAWIDTYWTIAHISGIKGYGKTPPQVIVEYDEINESILGYFSPSNFSITVNTLSLKHSRKKLIELFKKKDMDAFRNLKDDPTKVPLQCEAEDINRLLAYRMPSSTLPHELEHARRNSSHFKSQGGGGHTDVDEILIPGEEKTYRTFNAAANAVYQKVLEGGFYEKLFKAY